MKRLRRTLVIKVRHTSIIVTTKFIGLRVIKKLKKVGAISKTRYGILLLILLKSKIPNFASTGRHKVPIVKNIKEALRASTIFPFAKNLKCTPQPKVC